MVHSIRNLGRAGICSMAIAAVDIALWDLKSRLLGIPLTTLLGKKSSSVPVYGSGGFTSYSISQLQKQFHDWAEEGIKMMKMKIGRDRVADRKRIRAAREVIGDEIDLFIDANGAYTPQQALEVAKYSSQYNVSWFEEPVSSDNLAGLSFIRSQAPPGMNITAGEYGYDSYYFRQMLSAQAVDVLQIDATRCAGISGFLHAIALSEAFSIPNSAHTAPSIHIAPCCSTGNILHIEFFHDHARIEKILFDNVPQPVNGFLSPNEDIGSGIEFRNSDAEKFRIQF
jgi:L-alanine-DL-glutamate epimerase-like enolase superfamily enzyme